LPIVDAHAHLIARESLDAARDLIPDVAPVLIEADDECYLEFATGRRSGPFLRGLFDVDRRLADMDEQGVDVQVVCVPPSNFAYALDPEAGAVFASLQNDAMLEVVAGHRDRLWLLATLPLQAPAAAVQEIERLAPNGVVRGVTIGTSVAGRDLDDPALAPVWEALEAAGLPVLVHPDQAAVPGAGRLGRYYLSNLVGNPLETTLAVASVLFGGVVAAHPKLRLLFVHGGGFAPYQQGRWDHGWSVRPEARAVIDAPPASYADQLFYDSLTHDALSLRFLLERAAPGHVLFGTDYPFDMGAPEPVMALRRAVGEGAELAALVEQNIDAFLRPSAT
jgi:aminocarboxymuconate-semialdehyde decarboxylase